MHTSTPVTALSVIVVSLAMPEKFPVIDIWPLLQDLPASHPKVVQCAEQLGQAVEEWGFFMIAGHGVPVQAERELLATGHAWFQQPEDVKSAVHMSRSKVYRGYFPCYAENTGGVPDTKAGMYFERELPADHPKVLAGWPMHGANQWPSDTMPRLQPAVQSWMQHMERVGFVLLRGMALSLGMREDFFSQLFTDEPFTPFRLFHYPPPPPPLDPSSPPSEWGVAEHTDYGVLTLLLVDGPGLQIKRPDGHWVSAPYTPGTLVVNIGDITQLLTGGLWKATPHRVAQSAHRPRLSAPFFMDPPYSAVIRPLLGATAASSAAAALASTPGAAAEAVAGALQEGKPVRLLYGAYILSKVMKVFPWLASDALAKMEVIEPIECAL